MSTAIACPNCSDISITRDIGFSDDFAVLQKYGDREIADFRQAAAFKQPIGELIDSLIEVYIDCSVEDWDGMGATPVTENTMLEAAKLIYLLPSSMTFPLPSITVEPSGDVALEWFRSDRSIFVVSVNGCGEITYAGLYGTNKTHGTEYLSNSLPPTIAYNLKRLYASG